MTKQRDFLTGLIAALALLLLLGEQFYERPDGGGAASYYSQF